jgi:hypothetical protein
MLAGGIQNAPSFLGTEKNQQQAIVFLTLDILVERYFLPSVLFFFQYLTPAFSTI